MQTGGIAHLCVFSDTFTDPNLQVRFLTAPGALVIWVPSKYNQGSTLLDFSDQMGTGTWFTCLLTKSRTAQNKEMFKKKLR
jgi:hypothetical protein